MGEERKRVRTVRTVENGGNKNEIVAVHETR